MKKKSFRYLFVGLALIGSVMACSLPGASAPTPFSYPTPDMTMTALFASTTAADSTEPPPTEAQPTATLLPSATLPPTQVPPTETPLPTSTPLPTNIPPTPTLTPTVSYVGPGARSGVSITASYFTPTINGDLWDWSETEHQVNNVAYGAENRSSAADLSGTVMVAWDDTYLYLGGWVRDDNYVQNATGKHLFKGDSLEILLDVNVSNDFYLDMLSGDDYQLGISPGKTTVGNAPEAYLWYPRSVEGPRSQVQIVALDTGDGYQFEVALPWSMFGITPQAGDHYGFGFSISDNDKDGTTIQQSMVSNLTSRVFTHPMTWGDLTLGQ